MIARLDTLLLQNNMDHNYLHTIPALNKNSKFSHTISQFWSTSI